jgi:transposase InsO family protein
VAGKVAAPDAAASLGISRSRLYQLRTSWLLAKGQGCLDAWTPGRSGGDHMPEWPDDVKALIRAGLAVGYSYAFAASEVLRLCGKEIDRSQVRHWAISEGLAKPPAKPRPPAHIRRWQRESLGELWQLDEHADHWFGPEHAAVPIFDMLDDCSRVQVGCSMYAHETVRAYIHFLRQAFEKYGMPLQIYVDQASFFRSDREGAQTQLERKLRFYGISFILANSPESKGKVERIHRVWQDRLEPYFRLNGIGHDADLATVNAHLEALRVHRNAHENHREIGCVPDAAWAKALREGRSKLRPVPRDPWWPYVWSELKFAMVGPRGVVAWNGLAFPTQRRQGERVIVCDHLDGTFSVLLNKPSKDEFPIVLFSNRPLSR